jgi:preprotein translocase subunit SecG
VDTLLNVVQIFISIFIVVVILSQVKEGGGGLFGGGQATGRTRRGVEKTLFQFTVGLAAVFLIVSILSVRVL